MKCKECEFREMHGRSESQRGAPGRKHYYCTNKNIKDCGNRTWGFIGFGTNTTSSPLVLKTSPRWCPLKNKK